MQNLVIVDPHTIDILSSAYHAVESLSNERRAQFRLLSDLMKEKVKDLQDEALEKMGWDCTNKYHRVSATRSDGMPSEFQLKIGKPYVYFQDKRYYFTADDLHEVSDIMHIALDHKEETKRMTSALEAEVQGKINSLLRREFGITTSGDVVIYKNENWKYSFRGTMHVPTKNGKVFVKIGAKKNIDGETVNRVIDAVKFVCWNSTLPIGRACDLPMKEKEKALKEYVDEISNGNKYLIASTMKAILIFEKEGLKASEIAHLFCGDEAIAHAAACCITYMYGETKCYMGRFCVSLPILLSDMGMLSHSDNRGMPVVSETQLQVAMYRMPYHPFGGTYNYDSRCYYLDEFCQFPSIDDIDLLMQ